MDKKKITNMEVKKTTEMVFFVIYADREPHRIPIFLII